MILQQVENILKEIQERFSNKCFKVTNLVLSPVLNFTEYNNNNNNNDIINADHHQNTLTVIN